MGTVSDRQAAFISLTTDRHPLSLFTALMRVFPFLTEGGMFPLHPGC